MLWGALGSNQSVNVIWYHVMQVFQSFSVFLKITHNSDILAAPERLPVHRVIGNDVTGSRNQFDLMIFSGISLHPYFALFLIDSFITPG